ncbi:hypothetical protein HDU92_003197 [Lobulomyces angularis]|nr:hypothetical protein HDU92_003197 [Lobulomyces angularis]
MLYLRTTTIYNQLPTLSRKVTRNGKFTHFHGILNMFGEDNGNNGIKDRLNWAERGQTYN